MSSKELLELTSQYCTNKEQALIKKAYNFANKAHKGQKRVNGEPYIIHPLSIAKYLAKNKMDVDTITAALMHDVIEDTSVTTEEMKKNFGDNITNIVQGLTKLDKIKIKKSWFFPINPIEQTALKHKEYERHLESLRKMLMAMTKNIRIILIKLADRLHNMQTLDALPKQKQTRIAKETLEIYAPIAHRLGMGQLKGNLEDLSFIYLYPQEYKKTKELAGKEYKTKENQLEKARRKIITQMHKNNIPIVEIHGRKKHLYSLWKKLQKHDNDIKKIYDVIALRVIVKNTQDCYKVLGLIHKMWKPLIGRIKDYIAMPKPNSYQSLHTTIFGPDGEIIEIQIRTSQMHQKAEYGIAAHWHYLKTNKQSEIISKDSFSWIKDLATFQENFTDKHEWSKLLKLDFFEDRIFAFTPQGDIHDLPAGGTPVDFAYAIHSEVGNNTVGSKVNGKIVRLNYKIKNGDIVEIITSKKSKGPKRDWLKSVKTSKAKDKIKSKVANGITLPFIR